MHFLKSLVHTAETNTKKVKTLDLAEGHNHAFEIDGSARLFKHFYFLSAISPVIQDTAFILFSTFYSNLLTAFLFLKHKF